MLRVNADGFVRASTWLSLMEGFLVHPKASLKDAQIDATARYCEQWGQALSDDFPATAALLKSTHSKLANGATTDIIQLLLEQYRASFTAELRQRMIVVLSASEHAELFDKSPRKLGRGRPPKPWWEELLLEMVRRIFAGEFWPENQADLERAMLEWVEARELDVGETQVREHARRLFHVLPVRIKNRNQQASDPSSGMNA
jgi:hypothetical protein